MSGKFSKILDKGAAVDEIFKDDPMPKGSNPFGAQEPEVVIGDDAKTGLMEMPGATALSGDYENLLCDSRKLAAVEALFKLIARENLSFGQLASEILRIALEHVKSEAGSFIEIDYQNECMFFRAAAGRSSENLLNFTVPNGQGIAGFVCETMQPMTLSNVDDSSVHLKSISNAVGFEAKNLAAYPVVIRGTSFGCLELLNRLGESEYTEADKEVLATIAEYAGKVIENRLLVASLSKAAHSEDGKKPVGDAA